MRITRLTAALVACCVPFAASASIEDVDALVESVRQEALKEAAHDEERINEFLAERELVSGLWQMHLGAATAD